MEALAAEGEQVVERGLVRLLANLEEVPERVVENEQHAGFGVEIVEDDAELLVAGVAEVLVEALHPGAAIGGGKIVYAEVELGALEGDGPLGGDRDAAGAGDGA